MAPKYLTCINVNIAGDGILSLVDRRKHGCIVFDVSPDHLHFELQLETHQNDAWWHKAGAYAVGIVNVKYVPRIALDTLDYTLNDICQIRNCSYSFPTWSMSTGSFRFSDLLFDDDAENTRIFDGFLAKNQTLIMHYRQGKLGYRLDKHLALTDVTNSMNGCGCPASCKVHSPQALQRMPREPTEHVAPCVWVFAETDDYGTPPTVQINLRFWKSNKSSQADHHPSTKKMKALYHDRRFTDCKIECCDEQFLAHRVILCRASPLFEAAFTGPWKEGEEAVYTMQKCYQPVAVKLMLEFLYTDKLPEASVETLIALLPLAVYFQLDDLCSIAAGQLIDSITEEHVVEIAGLLKKFSSHECIHWALAELMGCVKRNDNFLLKLM